MPGVIPASAAPQAPSCPTFPIPSAAGAGVTGKWEVGDFTAGQAKRLGEQTAPVELDGPSLWKLSNGEGLVSV